MPLVRFQVKNEYGLGQPELYREVNREDPKAVLDGVAVAGLVGILRQLGDLAEFAADVFHGLQEQAMITSSRSHKLMVRVQRIEAALPPLEKAILAQKNHIHFAYTAGSVWHAHLQNEQNHFIYSDLPQFIMDSYEESSDPPRLHLLDKFDAGGPGSCVKRYSDPTFFRRASANSGEANVEKVLKDKKSRRSKKKRTWPRNEVPQGASISKHSDRSQFASRKAEGQISPSQSVSTFDSTLKSDKGGQSNSFDSKMGSGYIECVFHPSYSMKLEEDEQQESSFSSLRILHRDSVDSASDNEHSGVVDDIAHSLSPETPGPTSSCATWEEKTEIVELAGHHCDHDETAEMLTMNFDQDTHEEEAGDSRSVDHLELQFDNEDAPTSVSGQNQLDDVESEPDNYMDALNTIESESETDLECQMKQQMEQPAIYNDKEKQDGLHGLTAHHSELQPSNLELAHHSELQPSRLESHTAASLIAVNLSNMSAKEEIMKSISPHCCADKESPKMAVESSGICNYGVSDSCGNDEEKQDELHVLTAPHSELQPSNLESHTAASLDILTSFSLPKSISSHCSADLESPKMAGESSGIGNSAVTDSCGNDDLLDGSNTESAVSNLPYCVSKEPNPMATVGDQIIRTTSELLKSPTEPFAVQSVKFWTNGGLLGLEPSKPPVLSVLDEASQASVTSSKKDDTVSFSIQMIANGDGDSGKPGKLVQKSKSIEQSCSNGSVSCHNDQDGISDKTQSWKILPNDEDSKREKYGEGREHSLTDISAVAPITVQSVRPNVKAVSTEASQRHGENASQIFRLTNRFLGNGFQRKESLLHEEKSEPPTSRKAGVYEQKIRNQNDAYQTFAGKPFKGYFSNGSPINSPPSSPPLQHMKISFQPINGSETSKLKLKFPDGTYRQDNSRDTLPSFQLVPEPATPHHEIGSDSDDDTFCRSSAYISDDCHSDSNSEQWESDDTPHGKDDGLYDALHRISSTESVSSSAEIDRPGHGSFSSDYTLQNPHVESCVEPCQSDRSLDIPSLISLNPLFVQEMKSGCGENDLQQLPLPKKSTPVSPPLPKEPTAAPPPLPPMQWRLMKSHSDLTIGKQDSSEALDHDFDLKILGSTISPLSKPSPVEQQQMTDEAIAFAPKGKQPDWQKSNGQEGTNQTANGRGIDENDDFLHQIRAKSFNLRRTVTEKPAGTPKTTANVKVTAILEKANAIRQVIGSDDGEDDDNWSDT